MGKKKNQVESRGVLVDNDMDWCPTVSPPIEMSRSLLDSWIVPYIDLVKGHIAGTNEGIGLNRRDGRC